ncbi:MAG: hypothetical protein RLZZ385_1286 [Pseudomonadota bacterium]
MIPDDEQARFAPQLARLQRARNSMLVCFFTLPLYVAGLLMLLNNGRTITLFMVSYMVVYAVFAVNMVVRPCPRCGEQFFVRRFFLNPLARRCMHCRLALPARHREKF